MSTFKVVGVSTLKGQIKVRFANDMSRVKMLVKGGHEAIELIEMPTAVTKPEAVTFLKGTSLYALNADTTAAIDAADAKYNGKAVVKVKAPKAPKAVKTTKATKAAKPTLDGIKAKARKAKAAAPVVATEAPATTETVAE